MGWIICKKHGGNGITLVCAHIHAKVVSEAGDVPVEKEAFYPIRWMIEGDWIGSLYLCAACAQVHGVPREGVDVEDERFDGIYEAVGGSAVCGSCFEERYG